MPIYASGASTSTHPQADTNNTGCVDFWGFLGIRLFWVLHLKAKGFPLVDWLSFCCQRHSPPKRAPQPDGTQRRAAKPWHRQQS